MTSLSLAEKLQDVRSQNIDIFKAHTAVKIGAWHRQLAARIIVTWPCGVFCHFDAGM